MRIEKRWLFAIAAAFLVAVPVVAVAQQRYIDSSYPYAVCENCHASEGYLPVELVPVVPPEVPPDRAFNVSVVIVNPWEHQIRKIDAALNISLAEDSLEFLSGGSNDKYGFSGDIPRGEKRQRPLEVRPGLTGMSFQFNGSPGLLNQNQWQVRVLQSGDPVAACEAGPGTAQQANTSCSIDLDRAELPASTQGDWFLEVEMAGSQNTSGAHHWEVTGEAEYNVDNVKHKNAETTPTIKDIGPFGQQVVTWRVRSTGSTGEYTAIFQINVELYHNHETFSDSDSAFIDDRTQYKAQVGDNFVPAETNVGGLTVKRDTTAFMRSWGKVTGFASLLMILPSFLFVGVFSKQNKYAMNRFFGSARNRIVWHAAVSWVIILLAVIHMALFLLEPRFDEFEFSAYKWVSGWAALAFMFGLGVTGLWQIPFTKKMGYKWWRWLHMYMGIAAFVLSIVHTLWDGEEFAWLVGEKSKNVQGVITTWLLGSGLV